MDEHEALAKLQHVEDRLVEMNRELADLRGEPCEKCCKHEGDKIIGRPGETTVLVGGYEAILCRACRNAWTVAVDESGLLLEYRKAVATEKATRDVQKGRGLSADQVKLAVDVSIESLVAAERKIFQFAAKWLAGATP